MKHQRWHERQWRRIEEEYDEPAREVVRVYLWEMRIPCCRVAEILCVSETSLRDWCKQWNLPTRRKGYERATPESGLLSRARLLGFESVAQAISHLRGLKMRWIDIQAALGCSASSVSRHIQETTKGDYCLTEAGRRVKQQVRRRLNAEGRRGQMPALISNPEKYYAAATANDRS